MTGPGRLARGLAALLALVGIVGGIPAALVLWGTSPVRGELSGESLRDLAYDLGSERVVGGVLTVAAWLVWLLFLRALVMEALAHRRSGALAGEADDTGRAGPGPLRRLARGLLIWSTMAAGSLGPLAGGAGASPPPPLAAVLPAASVAPAVQPPVHGPPPRLAAPAPAPDADGAETVVVIEGATDAWTLAEEHLGDGTLWNRLWEANRDRVQPDGARWVDPESTVLAGWELVIPTGDAGTGTAAPDAAPDAVPAPEVPADVHEVVVVEGDHFWGLAERQLAAAWGRPPTAEEITPYWQQMIEANRERLVPPGDPDLIRPGQVLVTPPVTLEEAELRARVARLPAEEAVVETGDTAAEPAEREEEAVPAPATRDVPEEVEPDEVEPDDGVLDIAPWAAAGIPALLAAGVTSRIGRLRGERLRRRTRADGDGVPAPAGEAQATELRWRAIADGEAAEWVDAAVRYLSRAVRQSRRSVALMGVRTGPDGLELLLSDPCDEAAPGFVAERSGWIWRLLCDDLHEIKDLAADELPYAQGLVTLGRTDAGATALVDVEHLGVVSVEGDAEHVRTWLMGVSLEVATASWADGVHLHLVGGLTELGALPSVSLLEGAGTDGVVRGAVTATGAALGSHPTTQAARADGDREPCPPLTVVVASGPVDASVVAAAAPGRGAAVVAAGPVDGATWRLVAGADGRAHLYPFGLAVTLSGVDQRTALDTAHLLTDAAAPAPAVAGLPDRASVLLDPRPARPEPVDPALEEKYDTLVASILEPGEIEVAVLGPPTVTGWKREPRDRSVEIVVYLATHEGPVPGDRLRDRVFPPGFTGRSLAEAVSRTRRALGSSASGDDHLLPARERTYQLGPGVRSDLARFRRLHAAAQQAPVACEVKLLRSALALVRAQPFSDCPAGGYGWADAENISYELQAVIADDAQRLAELALGRGNAALAEWAARQGLRASPGNESLYCDLATAKYHQGDLAGFRAVVDEARAFAHRLDPHDGLHPRTHRLFGEIAAAFARAQRRAASG